MPQTFDLNMMRSFIATLAGFGTGLFCFAIGTSVLVLTLGDRLSYGVRKSDFMEALGFAAWVGGVAGGTCALLLWFAFVWPLCRLADRYESFRRWLLYLGVVFGALGGFAVTAAIGYWGGVPYTVLMILSGASAGFSTCYIVKKTSEIEQSSVENLQPAR